MSSMKSKVDSMFDALGKLSNEQITDLQNRLCEIEDKLEQLRKDNADIFECTSKLTISKLIDDLEDAVKFRKGYYKNAKGSYFYIRGVEIDGSCSLLRGGMNAEDRGVYVHFTEVSKTQLYAGDMNIVQLAYLMAPMNTEDKLEPATEQEFDAAYEALISSCKHEPEVCEDPQIVLDVYKKYVEYSRAQCDAVKEAVGGKFNYAELDAVAMFIVAECKARNKVMQDKQ